MTPTDPTPTLLARIPWGKARNWLLGNLMGWLVAAVFDTTLRQVLALLN